MSEYRPASWNYRLNAHGNGFTIREGDSPIGTIGMTNDPQVAESRARLTAAGPKLLAFVKAQRDAVVCVCRINKVAAKMGAGIPCTRCEADALLREAEGR